jgi:protein-L-isoaspartate(D-aspartate) O-methyltransferase
VASIQDHRNFYANFIVRNAGCSDERLIAAFACTEREHYLGDGPWSVFVNSGYVSSVSSDPCLLYQDITIAIDADRGINNGQPTLHARCLAACAPTEGDAVVHVGAGTGYYTAILARLVDSTGHVTAYEIETDLAIRARKNLQHLSNAEIVAGSASEGTLPSANLIYVNAGATHPLPIWLDALNVGGRLIFPLTPNKGFGVMLLVTRVTPDNYAARVVVPVAFIPCVGARDDTSSQILATAIQSRAIFATKSLHRSTTPDSTACCIGKDWWLSSNAISQDSE